MYSTLPTAGLNTRLRQLVDAQEISAYRVFDGSLIEAELLTLGKSWLMRRYFPESYKRIRPLHQLLGTFVDLRCVNCSASLLEKPDFERLGAIIAFVSPAASDRGSEKDAIYWACKGACDHTMQRRYHERGMTTAWEDVSDLVMPNQFLLWLIAIMSGLRKGDTYSDEAFAALRQFIIAISQKVFREITDAERTRLQELMEMDG